MKTITFFSEKGGVGKSSFSIMYASYLHFKLGLKVALADFNYRIIQYRKQEIRERDRFIKQAVQNSGRNDIAPYDIKSTWPIFEAPKQAEIEVLKKESSVPYARWFSDNIASGDMKDFDVIICDFPGSLTGGEFIQLASQKLLGLIIIPIDKEPMTLQSSIKLKNTLKQPHINGNYCAFTNRARLDLNNMKASSIKFAQILKENGFRILPDMVSNGEKMSTIDKVDIMRSTFQYPDFSNTEIFGKSGDLGIENLFIDVTRELAKTPDIYGTPETDLSVVASLVKKNDGRQFKGSSFPEYEI